MKFGRGVGKEIVDRIRSAKSRIWIISPFISDMYMDLLKSKYEKGLDVRIITTSKIDLDCARRPREFAHAKIYIIDDTGFYGSMNLTDSGVSKNYEIIDHVKPEQLPKLEKLFLKLWDNSLPIKEEQICEKIIFKRAWEYKISGIYDVENARDLFYITTSKELICLSAEGEVLWKTPITGLIQNCGDTILVYKYYHSKGSKIKDCVKIYLVRSDGVIKSSFDYRGMNPKAVYYDPEKEVVGIIEKMDENRYEVVGLDLNGNKIKNYTGRKDIIFFLPSIIRGDGIIELKIPSGDKFRVSPKTKKIAVIQLKYKDYKKVYRGGIEYIYDNIIVIKVYDVDSRSLYMESTVNLGRTDLIDFAVDDEGKVYLLTRGSIYIVENEVRKITIVKEEPMFESPKKSISVSYPGCTLRYYYRSCESSCQKIVLFNNHILILLADLFKFSDEYNRSHYTYWVLHALIYSKKDFRLSQVFRNISDCRDGFGIVRLPAVFSFDEGFILCYPLPYEKIEYYRKINLGPKVRDFMNFLQSVAPILKIDPENYRRTLLKLCEESVEEIMHYIETERQELIQKLQIKKSEIEKELVNITSQIEKIIQSGYNTKKVRDLLNFAKEALKRVNEDILESENKLKILKEIMQKLDQTPTLSVDVRIEEIKSKRLYRALLKLKTNSEFGVVAKIKNLKGNIESHFERRPIDVSPEATIEIFLVVREDPPLPVTVEIEYRYFEQEEVIDKLILIT